MDSAIHLRRGSGLAGGHDAMGKRSCLIAQMMLYTIFMERGSAYGGGHWSGGQE